MLKITIVDSLVLISWEYVTRFNLIKKKHTTKPLHISNRISHKFNNTSRLLIDERLFNSISESILCVHFIYIFFYSTNREINLNSPQIEIYAWSDELWVIVVFFAWLKLAVECWLHLPCSKFRTNLNTIISILWLE